MGKEKVQIHSENIADIKAATKLGQLYDLILEDNQQFSKSIEGKHALNIFFGRLLFCLFADDTEIFQKGIFIDSLASHTAVDGSDLKNYLSNLFASLNLKNREDQPQYFQKFPYVNGGLFSESYEIPNFSRKSRGIILDAGSLDWGHINPDIFGSMVQAIADPEERSNFGVHYTSISNILKVINPLFMDGLNEKLDGFSNEKDLEHILKRIYKFKIFDPACGSGNFLIVAYKELCRLEIEIFKELQNINFNKWSIAKSGIRLNQFYGLTIKDFDAEIAKLSLWLSEHQMNSAFNDVFGQTKPTLPLQEAGNIRCENATRIKWSEFCSPNDGSEVFVIGNPPYLGSKRQSLVQKEDMTFVFQGYEKYANIDYIGCWFKLAADYIKKNVRVAFVSTNSICQGTIVDDLWKNILKNNIEIGFAEREFPWTNNASNNAKVMCVIIQLREVSKEPKYIFDRGLKKACSNINAYLMDAPSIFVERRNKPLSDFPEMIQGNIPLDNGQLRLTGAEMREIVDKYPESQILFKQTTGSDELLNNIDRWCLWIDRDNLEAASHIPPIKKRIDLVREFREEGAENAKACADRPHQFCMTNLSPNDKIVIPIVSSIKRKYLPIDVVGEDHVVMNSALLINEFKPYIFGIISSLMHVAWVKTFGGKMRSDLRYSVGMCWYSFPFPKISKQKEIDIEQSVFRVMEVREKYSDLTLAQLYDSKMPLELIYAHDALDRAVEKCYRDKPFENDEERLEALFSEFGKLNGSNELIQVKGLFDA